MRASPMMDYTPCRVETENELTLEEVTRAARRLGFGLRPWIVRQQNNRGFSTTTPAINQNSGEQQQSPRLNQSMEIVVRAQQNPITQTDARRGNVSVGLVGRQVTTLQTVNRVDQNWLSHRKALKMNFLQQIADQMQEYSEEEQNPR